MEYPEEVRERARELHSRGLSIREIERRLAGPSRMAVWRWIAGAHDGPGARVLNDKLRIPPNVTLINLQPRTAA